jgi:acyl carrier protein
VTDGGGAATETASPLAEDIYRLAAERFQVAADSLGPQSNGENTPGWSSLTSVELVLALEEHFQIAFSPREVMTMISLGDVISAVQKHVPEAE